MSCSGESRTSELQIQSGAPGNFFSFSTILIKFETSQLPAVQIRAGTINRNIG